MAVPRWLVFGGLTVGVTLLTSAVLHAQDPCAICKPALDNYASLSGNYDVCIESDSSHDLGPIRQNIAAGIAYWEPYFEEASIDISFSFFEGTAENPCSGHDIKVKVVPNSSMSNSGALAEAHRTPNGRGAEIWINEDELGNSAIDWNGMGAHEMGHILDFDDVRPPKDCSGKTLMWHENGAIPPGGVRCADKTAASQKYKGGTPGDGEYWIPSGDCYDIWLYVEYYWWGNGEWHYSGWNWVMYLYTDCENGPPY